MNTQTYSLSFWSRELAMYDRRSWKWFSLVRFPQLKFGFDTDGYVLNVSDIKNVIAFFSQDTLILTWDGIHHIQITDGLVNKFLPVYVLGVPITIQST